MIDGFLSVLTLTTAALCGLMAGAYFVFSVMVMPALARLPSDQGIAAMQAVNIVAIRPVFMTALFLPGLLSVVLIIASIANWGESEAPYVLIGSALYVAGSIIVTAAYNVPRNNALALIDPDSAGADEHWRSYVSGWTAGNHVRALVSLAAAILLMIALTMS